MPIPFEHTYAALPERFFARVAPTPVSRPAWLAFNAPLAEALGLDPAELGAPEAAPLWAGNRPPENALPIALAYAGHQFGGFSPRLGDGRAILLGEVVGRDGLRRDVQLKGAGPTPFSRGGDGRAAIGPVLREFLVSEAMAALGVPTTRALAAVTTGEPVYREDVLPGAVLTRVAASHLRVGTFEFFAARDDREALALLTRYALDRHYPDASREGGEALALLEQVIARHARLVARWLALGFVHGVMNTDNTSISGETIDYGPCAFLDAYAPSRTFSSIDRHGRYAFSAQPRIALWNLSCLAQALLPLVDDATERGAARLEERLREFPRLFADAHAAELAAKLGLVTREDGDLALAEALLTAMAQGRVDHTTFFRGLARAAESPSADEALAAMFEPPQAFHAWAASWRARLDRDPGAPAEKAARIRAVNPAFIPRNHRVEEAIAAARAGDLGPFERLRRVLERPFDEQPEHAELAAPPGEAQWSYRTFCGT
jgi:uncharacterized protein YdiU (UPF0061 family)